MATSTILIPRHSARVEFGCDGMPHRFFEGECVECSYSEEQDRANRVEHQKLVDAANDYFWKDIYGA